MFEMGSSWLAEIISSWYRSFGLGLCFCALKAVPRRTRVLLLSNEEGAKACEWLCFAACAGHMPHKQIACAEERQIQACLMDPACKVLTTTSALLGRRMTKAPGK
jgi:hypothetical protein